MGLRRADEAFADQVRAAGATCEVIRCTARAGRPGCGARWRSPTWWRGSAPAARHAGRDAGAYVYSSVTAALLQPRRAPAAVRFDGIAALNRPGAGGAWQRRRERSVLRSADLLLPWSEPAAEAARRAAGADAGPMVVLPPPVSRPLGGRAAAGSTPWPTRPTPTSGGWTC